MTVKAKVSRRGLLQGAGAAALAAPLYSKSALASSGEVNILMWSDYLPPEFISGFEAKTGIKVNYTGIGSNEEIINKMKATKGRGVDICSPTNMRSPAVGRAGVCCSLSTWAVSTSTAM